MRCSTLVIVGAATIAAFPLQARLVSAGAGISWGKPGVSLQDYRSDAVACGRQAAALDVSRSGPAESFILASRLLENPPDIETAGDAMRIAAPERNFAKVGDMLKLALDDCLVARGYRQFKLTGDQRARLGKLATGSRERHAYLHSLASNPDILARQAVN